MNIINTLRTRINIERELNKTQWKVLVKEIRFENKKIKRSRHYEFFETNDEAIAYAKSIGSSIYGDDCYTKIEIEPPKNLTK